MGDCVGTEKHIVNDSVKFFRECVFFSGIGIYGRLKAGKGREGEASVDFLVVCLFVCLLVVVGLVH